MDVRTLFAVALLFSASGAEVSARPLASPMPVVQAERISSDSYRVSWQAWKAGVPVDVFVANRPDAPASARRQLVDDDRDGTAVVTVPAGERPYFYLQPPKGQGRWVAERLLPLEGGRNFRDLGGYRTTDGRTVRWGKVFRSGSMAGLTAADYTYLGRLGIQAVCDFRTAPERQQEPNQWVRAARVSYWTRDYELSGGDLGRLFGGGKVTPAQVRTTMAEMYRALPYEQVPAYREMFRQMLAGQLPLAFNCSAGKDRAGLAAALVLTALGVPRETVFADYALTDKYLAAALARNPSDGGAISGILSRLPKDVAEVLMSADPAYIRAAFDEMTKRDGSPEGYLRKSLGVGPKELAALRKMLLQ